MRDRASGFAAPLLVLVVGTIAAFRGRSRNRGLTIGATIILAVVAFAFAVYRNPALLR